MGMEMSQHMGMGRMGMLKAIPAHL